MLQGYRTHSHVALPQNTPDRMTPSILTWLMLLHCSCISSTFGSSSEQYANQSICHKRRFQELSCSSLNLSSVPNYLESGLKKLDLSNNFIRTLNEESTATLRSLQELDLSFNRLDLLTRSAGRNLVQLQSLNLTGNNLDRNRKRNSAALQSLKSLKVLELSQNNLNSDTAALYLKNMSSLEHLGLARNKLTKLSSELFHQSPNLESISLEDNIIVEIDEGTFEGLKRLRVLNLAFNSLRCISDFQLKQLLTLNLSRNSIEFFVTSENEDVYLLETLDLSYNRLLYFPLLPKRSALQYLYLQNNEMGSLTLGSAFSEVRTLYQEITRLDTPNSKTVFKLYSNTTFTNLVHLDLSNNLFTSFPFHFLHDLIALQHLNLSDNCLQNFTLEESAAETQVTPERPSPLFQKHILLPSMRTLDLHSNLIHYLPPWFFELLPQIERVNLGKNSLQPCAISHAFASNGPALQNVSHNGDCVDFSGLGTLKHLDLHENNIAVLFPHVFHGTPLVSLDLAGNTHLRIAAKALDSLASTLQELSVSGNLMINSDLPLPCLKELRRLDLSNNLLGALPPQIRCSPLVEIDVRNNSLTGLDVPAVTCWSRSLQTIQLSRNSFSCCTLDWLRIMQESKVDIDDLEDAVCFYQQNYTLAVALTRDHSQECPHGAAAETTFLLGLLIVAVLLITAAVVIGKLKYQKPGTSVELKSNKVASFEYTQDIDCGPKVAKLNLFETET
ncbi:transforming growth factor beta activator LRRC32-like [Acipenser ruthenus]|uniref:transforming growth factor beta activator LRRC32-like n=1 Tax=Acipenser ruthenus TaxID=7906 RepID=UPI002741C050|nr:transforming growth factor beta activator LRRC32-like [Acipenser ruthenus]